MDMTVAKKACKYSLLSLVLTIILFQLPAVSATEPEVRELIVDVSPKIINIASERNGEIRIATRMSYSFFTGYDCEAFVYFNGSDSVENIRGTRDSLGNLILKFNLADLLALGDILVADTDNDVKVVIVVTEDLEYSGGDVVYIVDKQSTGSNPRSRTLKIR